MTDLFDDILFNRNKKIEDKGNDENIKSQKSRFRIDAKWDHAENRWIIDIYDNHNYTYVKSDTAISKDERDDKIKMFKNNYKEYIDEYLDKRRPIHIDLDYEVKEND